MNWPALRSGLRRTNYAGRPVTLAEGAAVSALLATGTALAGSRSARWLLRYVSAAVTTGRAPVS